MKDLLKKKTVKIGLLIIVLLVAAVIIGINVQSAQRQREYDEHIKAAEKYLTELDYEQAIAEYTLAYEIEPSEEVLDALEQTYLVYAQTYVDAGDYERAISILEEGYARIGRGSLQEKIEESQSIILAAQYVDAADYGAALEIYDRLLEQNGENDKIQSDVGGCLQGGCLQAYLDLLIDQGRYDEAKRLIEKNQGKVHNVDFQTFLDRIAEYERVEAEKLAFLQKVYDLMAAGNYREMRNVDGSEEADAFMSGMESDFAIYVPEGNDSRTGMGAGVYRLGAGRLYYYGNYENGSRSGTGACFINSVGGGYESFNGQWQNDAPNGAGIININYGTLEGSENGYSGIYSGNLVNGLFDGAVDYKVYWDNTYDLSFTAVNGVPQEDVTAKLLSGSGNTVNPGEGQTVFAFDHHGNNYIWQSYTTGETLGVMNLTFPNLSTDAPKPTVQASGNRTSNNSVSTQESAASGGKYSYDEIPLFIQYGDNPMQLPAGAWSPEDRKKYGEMWEQLWGYNPWEFWD